MLFTNSVRIAKESCAANINCSMIVSTTISIQPTNSRETIFGALPYFVSIGMAIMTFCIVPYFWYWRGTIRALHLLPIMYLP